MAIRPWAVGLFIVAGLGLLTVLLFIIGNRQEAFEKHVVFQTQFSNLSGLAPGAKVRVSGFDAGKIKDIAIPKNGSEKFRLNLQVEEKLHPMIRTDSVVTIETDGVVGDKFLLIRRGSDQAEVAKSGATLPSKEPLDLSAMMDKAAVLLQDVHATVGDVRGRVDGTLDSIHTAVTHADGLIADVGPNVQKIASDGGRITGSVDTLVADLNAGKGPAGMLLRDENTKRDLQATLANVKETSVSANEAAARVDQVIGDFQSRQLVAKAQATLENVQSVSQQLNTTVKDALAQDTMGEDGAANLRETLTNVNRSTANLADDTEALKRNFFFRGFFKKRGFYSLDQITPADYSEACARHGGLGLRLWLQASTLFVAGPDGKEELTEAGRGQIDEQVAPVLNRLAGRLVVVEGYDVNGSPAEQSVLARRRADQVRRYLETRYHLRHSDVGIVAMGSTVPPNAGRSSWDGAAVRLLEEQSKK